MQVCGTSTGGILALGTCVATVPVRAMTDVYENPRRLPDRGPEAIWIKDGAPPTTEPSLTVFRGLCMRSTSELRAPVRRVAGGVLAVLAGEPSYDASGIAGILKRYSLVRTGPSSGRPMRMDGQGAQDQYGPPRWPKAFVVSVKNKDW